MVMTTTILAGLLMVATSTAQPQRMDGRLTPPVSGNPGLVPLRLALLPLRGASWLVFKPIEVTTGLAERQHWYERAYETLTSDDRLVGVRPLLRYDTGLAISAGLRVFDRRTLGPGSLLEASARGGLANAHVALGVETASGFSLGLAYDHRSDAVFGGTRGESREELEVQGRDVARYADYIAAASAGWYGRLARPLAFEARATVERRTYGNGISRRDDPAIYEVYCGAEVRPCIVDPVLVPGFEEGIRVARGDASLELDTRSHPRYSSGVVGHATWSYTHGIAGDPAEHHAAVADLGGVVAFGDRTLTGRLRSGFLDSLGSAPVAFDELLTASGESGVRGLTKGRLRGHTTLIASAEYRWLLSPWLDAVLSVDRGGAFGPWFDGLSYDRMFTSLAIGVVTVNPRAADYTRAESRFGAQIAFTPDDGVRVSLALSAW